MKQSIRFCASADGASVAYAQHGTGRWFSNYRIGERTAATKILVDRETDTIVGAHMFGPDYGELIYLAFRMSRSVFGPPPFGSGDGLDRHGLKSCGELV